MAVHESQDGMTLPLMNSNGTYAGSAAVMSHLNQSDSVPVWLFDSAGVPSDQATYA